MIHPVSSVKSHVSRNRKKYLVVTHAAAVAAGVVVGRDALLWSQLAKNPEAFNMLYPAK